MSHFDLQFFRWLLLWFGNYLVLLVIDADSDEIVDVIFVFVADFLERCEHSEILVQILSIRICFGPIGKPNFDWLIEQRVSNALNEIIDTIR